MNLAEYIEHTLLKPDATNEDLKKLFEEAKNHKFKGVCVNPVNVKMAKSYLNATNVEVVTVVGFPLGASLPEVKAFEAKKAIEDGADEIDMVISIQGVKNKDWDFVKKDIEAVRSATIGHILKVILETDLLDEDEIIKACEVAIDAKADFVKTSTGFVKNGVGAKVDDVQIMSNVVSAKGLQVKASGGIRDKEKAIALIEAGAVRLGTSSGVKINS
ncbi:MAG: deoxyribose-phosphate aldolase [Candidatus Gastranaerophilales bacterium]|nr:deoxyribose-phosphate aldolase [Candidatus Gastranaerophilales bacterium]